MGPGSSIYAAHFAFELLFFGRCVHFLRPNFPWKWPVSGRRGYGRCANTTTYPPPCPAPATAVFRGCAVDTRGANNPPFQKHRPAMHNAGQCAVQRQRPGEGGPDTMPRTAPGRGGGGGPPHNAAGRQCTAATRLRRHPGAEAGVVRRQTASGSPVLQGERARGARLDITWPHSRFWPGSSVNSVFFSFFFLSSE